MGRRASIIIATRNRRDDLERALLSCAYQTGDPEIIVIDDASTDGSSEMVRRRFPRVRLITDSTPRGYIVQRNRAATLARGEILLSIDDDAEFSSPSILRDTLRDFEASDKIAAVAIPYTEPSIHEEEHQRAPDRDSCWITSQFVGTAFAVRRRVFLDLGGFNEALVHQGEERDFCLRLLQAGFHVRLGNSAAICHHRSSFRDHRRMTFYGRRNDIFFVWQFIPFPQVVARLAATTARGIWHGYKTGAFGATMRGVLAGYSGILFGAERRPVSRTVYSIYRRARSNGPLLLPRKMGC